MSSFNIIFLKASMICFDEFYTPPERLFRHKWKLYQNASLGKNKAFGNQAFDESLIFGTGVSNYKLAFLRD